MNKKNGVEAPKGYTEVYRGNLVFFANIGDSIEGKLIGSHEVASKFKNEQTVYDYEDTGTKEVKSFFGSYVIDSLMKDVKVQQFFKLVFTDKKKLPGGKKLNIFRLFVK